MMICPILSCAISSYTLSSFLTYPIIAPYWADVDTRGTGSVYYRETSMHQLYQL